MPCSFYKIFKEGQKCYMSHCFGMLRSLKAILYVALIILSEKTWKTFHRFLLNIIIWNALKYLKKNSCVFQNFLPREHYWNYICVIYSFLTAVYKFNMHIIIPLLISKHLKSGKILHGKKYSKTFFCRKFFFIFIIFFFCMKRMFS